MTAEDGGRGSTNGGGAGPPGSDHLDRLERALPALRGELGTIERWGRLLAHRLAGGARLLVAGNGGSAAEAQHLTSELVGRFSHERQPLSAIALHADTSTLTAVGNDYGYDAVFARQVEAHGRAGDTLLLLSTSGRSANLVAAAGVGRRARLTVWALTGPAPNPLADAADASLAIEAHPATVQELHLVAVHLLCAAVDRSLETRFHPAPPPRAPAGTGGAGDRPILRALPGGSSL